MTKKRTRGERNWEDEAEDYELHVPPTVTPSDDLEHIVDNKRPGLVWVYGTPYIRAADGRLEPLD